MKSKSHGDDAACANDDEPAAEAGGEHNKPTAHGDDGEVERPTNGGGASESRQRAGYRVAESARPYTFRVRRLVPRAPVFP